VSEAPVLDACCGGRMFWFDKEDPRALFIDNRRVEPGHNPYRPNHNVNPDIQMDFTKMDFPDESFELVIFDPPHLKSNSDALNVARLYGRLGDDWREVISLGFRECFRVLKQRGVLVFKWHEMSIPIGDVIELVPREYMPPLIGNRQGTKLKTHFLVFMKGGY